MMSADHNANEGHRDGHCAFKHKVWGSLAISHAPGEKAEPVIERITAKLLSRGLHVETGKFGAMMDVSSVNQGPFTVLVEA